MARKDNGSAVFGALDKVSPVVTALGALLTSVGFILAFTVAGVVIGASVNGVELIGDQMVSNQLLFSQKIFYFHMPVAVTSFALLGFTAFFAAKFLQTRDYRYDVRARIATEIGLVMVVCTMFSGEMWERFEWGVWWTWEPRLTTYFILMLLVVAYFVLRAAVDEPERRALFASVYGIVMFVDVPICFVITRVIPSSVHPTIFRTDSGLSPDMLVPLLLVMFGMFCIAFGLFRLRLREEGLANRIEAAKRTLDEDQITR